LTLRARMDLDHERELRKRLRQPKREAPGWSHDLHRLWDAYLALEDDYLHLASRNRAAITALSDRVAVATRERDRA
jgi:hypothetical protein